MELIVKVWLSVFYELRGGGIKPEKFDDFSLAGTEYYPENEIKKVSYYTGKIEQIDVACWIEDM